jgi:RNA polymerase sigma factor (TIGR02999 family)
MSDVHLLLDAVQHDDPYEAAELLTLVYDDLRRLAAHRLAHEAPGQTLQPTALVHEAYLRLLRDTTEVHWDGLPHFFAAAAEAMRRILVENARRKRTFKHGGHRPRQALNEAELLAPEPRENLLALDEALTALAATDPDAAELIQLRYFGGLSIPEAAQVLGISPRSTDRLWAYARTWLLDRIKSDGPEDPS